MIYDELLIGSGLSAYSYLLGLSSRNEKKLVLCLSTDKLTSGNNNNAHIKVDDGNFKIVDNDSDNFYGPTSALGGLSNAWGGVLYKPNINYKECRSQKIIDEAAKKILDDLATKFYIHQKYDNRWVPYDSNDFNFSVDFYIVTAKEVYGWENSGTNIFPLFKKLVHELNAKLVVQKVIGVSFDEKDKVWTASTNESSYKSKKIVLAAGGLGNISLMNNFSSEKFSIMDHSPYQFFCFYLPFSKLKPIANKFTPIRDVAHFGNDVLAIYSLADLSKSFLLKMVPRWLPFKNIFAVLVKSVVFIQYWTDETIVKLNNKNINKYSYTNIGMHVLNVIKYGVLPIYFKKTRTGEGFHYVNAFNIENGTPLTKSNLIEGLTILGGAAISEIKPEHPTFSFMIDSYVKGKNSA